MAETPLELIHVDYDGQTTIRAVRSSEQKSPGFVIGLFKINTLVKTSPFQPGDSGSLTTDGPLTGTDYRVKVALSDGGEDQHAWGNRIGVVIAKATGVTARYDLKAVTASWTMQGTFPDDTRLMATLSDANGPRPPQPVTGSTATLLTPTPLGAGAQLQLQVMSEATAGPLVVLPLVSEVPAAAQVIYEPDAEAQIAVTFAATAPSGCAPAVMLFRDGALVSTTPGEGTQVTIPLTTPLALEPEWRISLAWISGGATGPQSAPLEVITALAADVTARYDLKAVTASWTQQGTVPPGARLMVTLRDADGERVRQAVSGSSVTLPVSTPLGAGAQLQFQVTADKTAGPLVVVPLVAAVPAAAQVDYDTGPGKTQIAVTFAGTAPAGYVPTALLLRDGALVGTTPGQGTQVTIPLAAPLALGARWAVSLAWALGGSSGPVSEPLALITAPPAISDAELLPDGTVVAGWRAQPGPPWATSGWARLNAPADPGRPGQPATAARATFTPSPPLKPGCTYALTMASVRGVVRGPASPGVLLPNELTPLGNTVYDGETVAVWWPDPAPEGATGSLVELLSGGMVIATGPGGGNRGSVRAKLDPWGSYTARLRWVSGTVTGPPGPEALVISGTTMIRGVQPASDGIEVRIDAPAAQLPQDTVYVPHLMKGDQDVGEGTGVSRPPVTARIAYQCDDQTTLTVRAQATYFSGSCHSYGPLGPPAPVLAVPPVVTHAALHGTALDVSWTLPPDPLGSVSATRIVLTPSGSPHVPAPTWFPRMTGTHATLEIGSAPDPALSWTAAAVVVSVDGPFPSVSPQSPGVPLLTSGPSFTKAVFDGQTVFTWLTWSDAGPSPALATGFRLELFSGTALVGQTVTSRMAGRVPLQVPLNPSAPLRLTASPLAPGAEYTAEPGPMLIGWPPELTRAASDAASVALDWREPDDPGSVIGGYEVVFTMPGRQAFVRLAPHDSRNVSFPAGLDPLTPAEVTVRAVGFSYGAEVFGPSSEPAPLLRGTPAVTEATVSDGLLRLAWTPVLGAPEGYAVTLTLDGAATTTWQAGTSAVLPVSGSPLAGAVAVQARRGVAASASATAPVMLGAPSITKVDWDGSVLAAAWTAPASPVTVTGYELTVRDGEAVVATTRTGASATTATIAAPNGAAGLAVTVAAFTGLPAFPWLSRGPGCPPIVLPPPGPIPTSVTINPDTGKATVTWTAVSPAPTVGYLVQRYRAGRPDGEPVTVSTTSVALPDNPAPFDDLEVAVAAKTVAGTATVTGPFGPRLRVLTEPAEVRGVDFDGRQAAVSWAAVPGATGYALTVAGDGVQGWQGHADGDQTTTRFPVTLANLGLDYQVVVQPLRGRSSGVCSSAPLVGNDLYVLPAPARIVRASKAQVTPLPVTAYLPDLAASGQQLTCLPIAPPQQGVDKPPFTLEAAQSPGPMKYKLEIGNGALAFDSARRYLADAYRKLLSDAETYGATPRGILALQQAIARLMPQTLGETLYYSYGLSSRGWVDLRPGMVLRVSFSSFDLTAVSGAPQWSSGYAGGTVVDYDIGDYVSADGTGWLVGFDAFVDWLVSQEALSVPAPLVGTALDRGDIAQSGGADAADLSYPLFNRPFYRLLFPAQLQAAAGPAVSRTGQQFTIAAAAKWQEIDAATAAPGGGVHVAYFRGRAVLRACIRVVVDGAEHVVPVGTTVGNLLDRVARRPPPAPLPLRGVRLYRAPGPVVLDPAEGYDAASSRVRLDWPGTAAWPAVAQDALSLPLLHGDRIVFGAGA